MLVKQLSVFMENKKGRLFHLTDTLGKNGIDLVTLSIADTKDYGIVRFIARDNEKALKLLKEEGFSVGQTDLIGIEVDDKAGALSEVLGVLDSNDISVEYLYSFVHTNQNTAKILFRVEQAEKALEVLKKYEHIKILNEKIL